MCITRTALLCLVMLSVAYGLKVDLERHSNMDKLMAVLNDEANFDQFRPLTDYEMEMMNEGKILKTLYGTNYGDNPDVELINYQDL